MQIQPSIMRAITLLLDLLVLAEFYFLFHYNFLQRCLRPFFSVNNSFVFKFPFLFYTQFDKLLMHDFLKSWLAGDHPLRPSEYPSCVSGPIIILLHYNLESQFLVFQKKILNFHSRNYLIALLNWLLLKMYSVIIFLKKLIVCISLLMLLNH